MPWAAGVYTKGNNGTGGWTGDAGNGIGIEAGRHDTQDNDFTTGINSTLNKDGTNVPSANLPMGGFRHTGVGLATARDSYATLGQAQDGTAIWGGTSGGTANAQTLTLTPAITAYAAGQRFRFFAGFTNTAAATLNVNGVGAVSVVLSTTGGALTSNYIEVGLTYEVLYSGTDFRLLEDPALIKRGDYENLGQSTGTANALVLTSSGPRLTSTSTIKTFSFIPNITNTAAVTVAIDGLPAINLYNPITGALGAGQLIGGRNYQLMLINGNAIVVSPSEEWVNFSPVISQTATLTYTNNYSYYKRVGTDLVVWRFGVTFTNVVSGSAGQQLVMTPPVVPLVQASYFAEGAATIFDQSANTIYTCVANFVGATALRFYTGSGTAANHFGATPSIGIITGDILSGVITYRV